VRIGTFASLTILAAGLLTAWACGSSSNGPPDEGTYDAAVPPPPPGDEPVPEEPPPPPPPPVPPCDYAQGFTDIQPLDTLNTPFNEKDMALAPDEKTLYYVSNLARTGDAGAKTNSLYRSQRTSLTAPFQTSVLVADPINVAGSSLSNPSLTTDLKSMYVYVTSGADGGGLGISVATLTGTHYGTPQQIVELAGSPLREPFITADGSTLYAAHPTPVGSGTTTTNLTKVVKDDNGDFGAPTDLVEFKHDKPYEDSAPVLTPDQLTIVFASTRPPAPLTPKARQLWIATRAKATDKFGVPTNLADLNATDSDSAPSFVSADGCRLYLWRIPAAPAADGDPPPTSDLFVAKRPPAPDPQQ